MSVLISFRDIVFKIFVNILINKIVLDLFLIMVGVLLDFMVENKNDDNYCKKKREL